MFTASRACVVGRPAHACLLLTAFLLSFRGTPALPAQNAAVRPFAATLSSEKDVPDIVEAGDGPDDTEAMPDPPRAQLDALYQIWLSLNCTGASWTQRDHCPEWAICTREWIRAIWLDRAGCAGTLSSRAWIHLRGLETLRLSENALAGKLPATWGRLSLRYLSLQQNRLSGTLPAAWSKIMRLRVLELARNELRGQLPAEWSDLKRLLVLRLEKNKLNSALPSQWRRMKHLLMLDLSRNALRGTLPAQWADMRRLKTLRLKDNGLHGALPAAWGNLTELRTLSLSDNTISGTLPASWSKIRSLELLDLANNQLVGSLPSEWSNWNMLQILRLNNNRLSGWIPPWFFRDLHRLRFLALHENRFVGPLPELSSHSIYDAVLLHGNQFGGGLELVGSPTARFLLALPGNFLISGPDADYGSAATTEPFIDINSQSPFFRPSTPPWKALGLVVVAFQLWLVLQVRLPRALAFIGTNRADAVVSQTISALYDRVLWHSLLACVNVYLYSSGGTGFCSIWDASGHTAAYCKGHQAFTAFLTIPMSTLFILPTLVTLPRHASPRQRPKLGWLGRFAVWLLLLVFTVITGAPSLLNVFFKSAPSVHPSLFVVLPIASAVLHVFVQPALLRKLASVAGTPYYELQVLQGASSWALPLAVLVWISPACRGSWWGLLEMCQQPEGWTCRPHRNVDLTMCRSNRTLDVSGHDCPSHNRTHCLLTLIVSAEEICGDRWPDPLRCTSSLVDVIGMFIFNKQLVTCFLTLALLFVASLGNATLPWWTPVGFIRTEEAEGTRSDFVVQSAFFGIDKRLISVSGKFSPTEVVGRLSVWSDLSLSWGLLYPPIAITGLIHLLLERWCYEKGRRNLRFPQQSPDDVVQMPRSTMIAWLMAANILAAVHTGSVGVD
eukprot:TRINITY_DN26120_c0_g1_i4.p1 TRINITY_DN26120_c0_g1~~TRINITY_DN26120_c0_g1_i4.p1  ORF type:complete len:897 (-),score=35.40 TRINITY_DN26120_c0_g1_i4:226-2916(-)